MKEAPPTRATDGAGASEQPTLPPELAGNSQYEVIRELGRGGMGVVYLARNRLLARQEVLKVVNKDLLERSGGKERFLREIQSAAMLSHTNVVQAYSALQLGEILVFAMQYVDGHDLAKVVKTAGALPVANACYYAQQAALGLQHAFEKKMVHRDIKPQNLILAREGKRHVVKILDFGLAKVIRENKQGTDLTGTGQMMGTPDYIAPEQTLDAARADIRADIYSLGCTLYYLLTGGPPFHANSLFELLQCHHMATAKALNLVRPDIPVELEVVVAKMMAKDPAQRYQKPVEVAQALAPFIKAVVKVPPVASAQSTNVNPAPAKYGSSNETRVSAAETLGQVAKSGVTPAEPPPVRSESKTGTGHTPTAVKLRQPPATSTSPSDFDEAGSPEPKRKKEVRRRGILIWALVAGGGVAAVVVAVLFITTMFPWDAHKKVDYMRLAEEARKHGEKWRGLSSAAKSRASEEARKAEEKWREKRLAPPRPEELAAQPPAIQRALRASVRLESRYSYVPLKQGADGSGVVLQIDKDSALILTDIRVVEPNFLDASKLQLERDEMKLRVFYITGDKVEGKVVWTAPNNVDLALVRAPCPAKGVVEAPWRMMTSVITGADVFAIGDPSGRGWTFTRGVVSSVRTEEWGVSRGVVGGVPTKVFKRKMPIIRTDALISWRNNHGGGLYNAKGELIGINTSILTSSDSGERELLSIQIGWTLRQFAPEMIRCHDNRG